MKKYYYRHGLSKHKLHKVWRHIKERCCCKTNQSYHYYGGRGISVCDEWLSNFMSFYNWCIENGWEKGLQIDRIDNDGNYEPSNCRFVKPRKNMLNRRKYKNNKSGYEGIYLRKDSNKWVAEIRINNVKIYLGNYITKKEAVDARNNYIIQNNLEDDYNLQKWRDQ